MLTGHVANISDDVRELGKLVPKHWAKDWFWGLGAGILVFVYDSNELEIFDVFGVDNGRNSVLRLGLPAADAAWLVRTAAQGGQPCPRTSQAETCQAGAVSACVIQTKHCNVISV